MAVKSRFLIDLRVGPRTLASAIALVTSVAMCCTKGAIPLLLADDHPPYRNAILQVFGLIKHRRRRRRRGRRKHPRLKAPAGLQVGIVKKVRDAKGNVSRLRRLSEYSLWLWRDLYNWHRVHGSLHGGTPAMALGLATEVWTVLRYVRHPVHVSDLQRQEWAELRNSLAESALDVYERKKSLPIS